MTPERTARLQHLIQHRQNDLTVVLENVLDPHNIAAVMRTCDAVGVMEIFVLNTNIEKIKYFDTRKSSSANKWMIAHQYSDVKSCFAHVRQKYKRIYSTHLDQEANDLYSLNLAESCALVFGNERTGLSPETLSFSDGNFIVPQVGIIRSLNISVACAVSLYEAYRQKKSQQHYATKKITETEQNMLLKFWKENDFSE